MVFELVHGVLTFYNNPLISIIEILSGVIKGWDLYTDFYLFLKMRAFPSKLDGWGAVGEGNCGYDPCGEGNMPITYYIFLYAIVYVGGVGVLINIYQFSVSISAFMSHGCITKKVDKWRGNEKEESEYEELQEKTDKKVAKAVFLDTILEDLPALVLAIGIPYALIRYDFATSSYDCSPGCDDEVEDYLDVFINDAIQFTAATVLVIVFKIIKVCIKRRKKNKKQNKVDAVADKKQSKVDAVADIALDTSLNKAQAAATKELTKSTVDSGIVHTAMKSLG